MARNFERQERRRSVVSFISAVWIQKLLGGREQRVVIYGAESKWVGVPSGVPQGSVLGQKDKQNNILDNYDPPI